MIGERLQPELRNGFLLSDENGNKPSQMTPTCFGGRYFNGVPFSARNLTKTRRSCWRDAWSRAASLMPSDVVTNTKPRTSSKQSNSHLLRNSLFFVNEPSYWNSTSIPFLSEVNSGNNWGSFPRKTDRTSVDRVITGIEIRRYSVVPSNFPTHSFTSTIFLSSKNKHRDSDSFFSLFWKRGKEMRRHHFNNEYHKEKRISK